MKEPQSTSSKIHLTDDDAADALVRYNVVSAVKQLVIVSILTGNESFVRWA